MSRERKLFSIILAIYLIGLFAATHIPVPNWIRDMAMSDKTMHIAAYTLLGFLMWFAVSFEAKADWRKLKSWLVLAILLFYGIVDEISQHFIGRGMDIFDYVADIGGITATMFTVSLWVGRQAIIVPAMVCPILIPGLVRSGIIAQGTILEFVVYFICFIIVSLITGLTLKNKFVGLFIVAADIVSLKIYAGLTDKAMGASAMLVAFIAMAITFDVLFYVNRVKRVTYYDELP